jgi:RNA polymerase sigma-70 factor, ECF subfamily
MSQFSATEQVQGAAWGRGGSRLVNNSFELAFPGLLAKSLRVARRVLDDPPRGEDIADIAAEALARAYMRWGKLGNLSYRDAWVMRVTANLAIDATRRRRPDDQIKEAPDPQESVMRRVSVIEAIRALPKRQREVVVLRYLCDLSQDEVARQLEVSAGAVKTHAHLALSRLRKSLGGEAEEVERVIAQ